MTDTPKEPEVVVPRCDKCKKIVLKCKCPDKDIVK